MAVTFVAAAQADPLPYPDIADTSHASNAVAAAFRDFFTVKSEHRPDALMSHFAKDKVLYIDATSGGIWPDWAALNKIFTTYMPKWPASGLSYPTRIYGDAHSALVAFTDTPELFGHELRILGAVSFDDQGKIIRWMDYWDGRSAQVKNSIKPTYPTDFHDDVGNATGRIHDVAVRLDAAFSAGDAKMAAAMFSNDAVFDDMALHAQILGRRAIERYLARALVALPYGKGATLAHTVGSDQGGGYEWRPDDSFPLKRGNTALALDSDGRITRLTTVYDSSLLPDAQYHALVLLSGEN
ncbi:MAG TPA: hypothetical protein VIJ42_15090 [Stellaceae bacterium]